MSGSIENIEEALYHLVYHRDFRKRFIQKDFDSIGLQSNLLTQLATVDTTQLQKTANKTLSNLLYGTNGEGGLESLYPKTLENWESFKERGSRVELIWEFMSSKYFEKYCDIPYESIGISLEEAFYQFLLQQQAFLNRNQNAETLEDEFLTSLLKGLLFCSQPNFKVESELIQEIPAGFFAIQVQWPKLILTAAVSGRFIRGEITPLIAEILRLEAQGTLKAKQAHLCQQFAITQESLDDVQTKLEEMGLLWIAV